MIYLNLKIISNERGLLYETDIGSEAFTLFAQVMGGQFVEKRLFHPAEQFKMRIIPRWDASPNYLKFESVGWTSFLREDPNVDILLESSLQDKPVNYFTVRWISQDQRVAYQLDFKISSLFEGNLRLALNKLFDKKILKENEEFRYEVYVRDHGLPTIDRDIQPDLAAYAIPYAPAPRTISKSPKPSVKLSIKSKVSLNEPKHRLKSYYAPVEMIDQPRSSALGVYVRRDAYLKLKEDVKVSKIKQIEVAGILLGEIFDDNGLYVDISETVPMEDAVGSFYSVRMDIDVWQKAMESANALHSGKILVGWYHTHLISKVKIDTESSAFGIVKATQQSFLSHEDLFIHNNFFLQPWHVAMLVDLRVNRDVFFYRFSNDLVDTGGFYLYNDRQEP